MLGELRPNRAGTECMLCDQGGCCRLLPVMEVGRQWLNRGPPWSPRPWPWTSITTHLMVSLRPESRCWEELFCPMSTSLQVPSWGGQGQASPAAVALSPLQRPDRKATGTPSLKSARLPLWTGPWVGAFPGQAEGWYTGTTTQGPPTVSRVPLGCGLPHCRPPTVCNNFLSRDDSAPTKPTSALHHPQTQRGVGRERH